MSFLDDTTIAIAIAALLGVVAQAVARRFTIPALVCLLVLGWAAGPDMANVVRPGALGGALHTLVGFAVAIILFEGGMQIDARALRRHRRSVIRLSTVGAILTAGGATVIARYGLSFDWGLSALFGALVMVTGPTVVTPLLKRLEVEATASHVLEAEGVVVDAIGAVAAASILPLVLRTDAPGPFLTGFSALATLALGTLVGVVAGVILAATLRRPELVPGDLRTPLAVAFAVALFQCTNSFLHEGGLPAVVAAGFIVGNIGPKRTEKILGFHEQFTPLLIGMLFILLTATVRMSDMLELGWPGLVAVLAIVLVLRPASVWIATHGTRLSVSQRAFIGWVGPRGIVAAAVAAYCAERLERGGLAGGAQLQALVFAVIAVSVGWASSTGMLAARRLGVRRKRGAAQCARTPGCHAQA